MKNPFDLMIWAIAIGFAWLMLSSITGIDDWLNKVIGRRDSARALAARIAILEKRITQLEEATTARPK